MAIEYVGRGTPYTRTSSGTSYTLNAPAGLEAGDVLLASVSWDPNGSQRAITVPEGWVVLRTQFAPAGGASRTVQVALLFRQAGPSEPSSWAGSVGASTSLLVAGVNAYRGAQGSLGSVGATAGAVDSMSTGSVNNTGSGSWFVVAAAYHSASANYDISISSSVATRRWIAAAAPSAAIQAAMWDSDDPVPTGSVSRTVFRSEIWSVAASVSMVLAAAPTTPATGSASMTLPKLSAAAEGEVHNDAAVAVSLPKASFAGEGLGVPPEATGSMSASLPALEPEVSAGTDVIGSMDASVMPSLDFEGETRFFGVRVIEVEADDRVIRVESRAVAD